MIRKAKSGRRRPKQERSKVTVAAILDAAEELLRNVEIGSLNTNRVAERAGVGVGSLYEYFADKNFLIVGLIERFALQIDRDVNAVFDSRGGESLHVTLHRLVQAVVTVYERDPVLHGRLLRHVPHIPVENPLDMIESPIRRRLANMLRACGDEVEANDLDLVALVCVHAVRRMVDAACADRNLGLGLHEVETEMQAMIRSYLVGRSQG